MELKIDDYMKREQYRYTTDIFKKKATEIHGDKYDYSESVYINKRTKLLIKCREHGDFMQAPMNHLRGQGCPICGKILAQNREMNVKNKRKTTDEFKTDVEKIYGNKYEVMGNYVNNKTKIAIYCHKKNKNNKEHGLFTIKPNDLICGHGCPKCVHSSMEDDIENFLIENKIKYTHQKKFDWLGRQSLDFYLDDVNIAIECQGKQHFKPVNFKGEDKKIVDEKFEIIKKNDEKKYNLCIEHGINLLYYTNNDNYKNEKYPHSLFTDKNKLLDEIDKLTNKI